MTTQVERLQEEIKHLREHVARLKREVSYKDDCLHLKNIELDALHKVWCSGGCKGGVHRYHEEELTEQMVKLAEKNTERLRQWFESCKFRDKGEGNGKG